MANSVDWDSIALNLVQGAAGLLPAPLNMIGAALLNQVFPQSTIDWDAIATAFSNVLQQDLDQSFLDQSRGTVQGIVTYMGTSYVNDKAGGESKDTLFNTDL